MVNRMDVVIRSTDAFIKKFKIFLNHEIHIKLEQDENPVLYTLREIGKDFLIVDYGESLRIIPMSRILFIQIGSYPKDR